MTTIYNPDRKAFLIKDEEDELGVVPFPFSDMNHKGALLTMEEAEGYDFSEYYKKGIRELAFRETYLNVGENGGDPQRLGWMLPIATLTTDDPEILAKEHMNQYVFFAYCYLLGREEVVDRITTEVDKSFGEILGELFPDGCLLVTNNDRKPDWFTFKKVELSLARNGFYKTPSGYCNPLINEEGSLNLIPAAEILQNDGTYVEPYIEDFLTKYAYNDNIFIRFFYLYQILEVLMNREMIQQLEEYLDLLRKVKPNYRKIENGLKETTESKRLAKIVENAKLKSDIIKQLDEKCNAYLESDEDNLLTQPESVYQVRNHIVHRFRIASSDEDGLIDVCNHIELYLYDLLIQYKLPKVNKTGT